MRLEPKSYSTKTILTTLPLFFWAGGQLLQWLSSSLFSGPFVLCAAFLLLGVVCVPRVLLLGVGGWQISLRAGRKALLRMWEVTLLPRGADQLMALCSVVVMIRARGKGVCDRLHATWFLMSSDVR